MKIFEIGRRVYVATDVKMKNSKRLTIKDLVEDIEILKKRIADLENEVLVLKNNFFPPPPFEVGTKNEIFLNWS